MNSIGSGSGAGGVLFISYGRSFDMKSVEFVTHETSWRLSRRIVRKSMAIIYSGL